MRLKTDLSNDEQIVNCLLALSLWAEVPPECVNLGSWRCGTHACFGGHLATWPEFQAVGVMATEEGAPTENRLPFDSSNVAHCLFGDWNLFYAKGHYPIDLSSDTHHETIVRRLEQQIAVLSSL